MPYFRNTDTMYHEIDTIVFDLGGVLIDWNPEYLFSKMFKEEEEMHYFLGEICNMDWNEQQDAGRSILEATEVLIQKHPQYEQEIAAYYGRWTEMLGGPIDKTVDILERLHQDKLYPLYALTNWSKETFPHAQERYHFLQFFQGIIVSGEEKLKKPDPRIYQLLKVRYNINPLKALFIDDSLRNIEAARAVGFHTVHFTDPYELEDILNDLEILEVVRKRK